MSNATGSSTSCRRHEARRLVSRDRLDELAGSACRCCPRFRTAWLPERRPRGAGCRNLRAALNGRLRSPSTGFTVIVDLRKYALRNGEHGGCNHHARRAARHIKTGVAAGVPKPAPARSSRKPQIKNFVLPAEVIGLENAFITEYFDATDRPVSWSALVEVALRELVKRDDRIDILSEYKVRARRPSVK
jgi:hypothetical protein